jgi:hypothetical protein
MLLVRGDPTVDVLAVRDIIRILKAGVEVDRGERSLVDVQDARWSVLNDHRRRYEEHDGADYQSGSTCL